MKIFRSDGDGDGFLRNCSTGNVERFCIAKGILAMGSRIGRVFEAFRSLMDFLDGRLLIPLKSLDLFSFFNGSVKCFT